MRRKPILPCFIAALIFSMLFWAAMVWIILSNT